MFKKRIANIVFYKVSNNGTEEKQATIFYTDGTVENVNFERGIDACEAIVQERHIQTKDAFREMINRDFVHVVSAQEFRDNFYKYVPTVLENADEKEEVMSSTGVKAPVEETHEDKEEVRTSTVEDEEAEEEDEVALDEDQDENGDIDVDDIHEEESDSKDAALGAAAIGGAAVGAGLAAAATPNSTYTPKHLKKQPVVEEDDEEKDEVVKISDDDTTDEEKVASEEVKTPVETSTSTSSDEEEKKPGFFKRAWDKIKNNKFIKRLILCTTAIAIGLGIYSCANKKSLEGEMLNSNIPSITDVNTDANTNGDVVIGDNVVLTDTDTVVFSDENADLGHFYEDPTLNALFNATSNTTQHAAMYNVGLALDGFNGEFASHYLEEGVDVRAALKFEEVVALQVAYNDYSKDQLKAIFNGADIRAEDLTRAYKDGTLQLMGAYAIETPEHPVDMSMLIESQEGKDFYKRYHDAFLAAKTATGDDKIRLVTEFYNMVRADFPITNEVRTEGISHSQNYDELEAYKLSVTPMIAAAEMMWQNLEVDNTLTDGEIDFINDLGLCNFAQKTFERAELISLTSDVDTTNPTYEQYREAFIKYYQSKGIYYIDDEHRELTKLQAFQDAVNWHFQGGWEWQGRTWTTTETHTEVSTHTETETTQWEETTVTDVDEEDVPEDIREDLQHQVDAEIEAENEQARIQAEQEAEEERQRLQAIEDQHAAEVEQEVMQDEQDLQETIDDINEQIEENQDENPANDQPINENDYDNIDFDDEFTDDQGNLDPSVENITTDPTGDQTGEPLPDPEDTGRDFDAEANAGAAAPAPEAAAPAVEEVQEYSAPAEEYSAPAEEHSAPVEESHNDAPSAPAVESYEEPVVESHGDDAWVESVPVSDDTSVDTYWVEEDPVDYSSDVDSYVESLVGAENVEEEDMEYTR